MFCNNCDHQIPENSQFCPYCGLKIIDENVDTSPIKNNNNSNFEINTFNSKNFIDKPKYIIPFLKIFFLLFIGNICSCGFFALLYFLSNTIFELYNDYIDSVIIVLVWAFVVLGILSFIAFIVFLILNIKNRHYKKSIEKATKISSVSIIENQNVDEEKINKLLSKGFWCVEEKDWQNAGLIFNSVLELTNECYDAHIGKLLVDLLLPTKKELYSYNKDISGNLNFQRALRYANESQEKELENLEKIIKRNTKEQKRKEKKTIGSIIISFVSLWLVLSISLTGYWGYTKKYLPKSHYNDAVNLYENKQYREAMAKLIENKDYEYSAVKYKEILYNHFDEVNVGDIVLFGEYELPYNDKSENVEWIVIDKTDSKFFLMSREIISNKKWNSTPYEEWHRTDKLDNLQWKDCGLRAWLNNDLLNSMFNKEELDKIQVTKLENNVDDKLFLLSKNEFYRYSDLDIYNFSILDDWWLRSRPNTNEGEYSKYEIFLAEYSADFVNNNFCDFEQCSIDIGVRPVMWVDFTK